MDAISLQTASSLTGRSRRTLWRRVLDGAIRRAPDDAGGRAMLSLDDLLPNVCVALAPADLPIVTRADAGDAEAQNNLALIFLAARVPANAVYWLELAAQQEHADAMHWLARCYIGGHGVARDQNVGLMWLAKSAAKGHAISQAQIDSLLRAALAPAGA